MTREERRILLKIKAPYMVNVQFDSTSEYSFDDMIDWAKQNISKEDFWTKMLEGNLDLVDDGWSWFWSGHNMHLGIDFYFMNITDATYFKLRWSSENYSILKAF